MDGKNSKFEYDWFYDGCAYSLFCVNKNKYTIEQAIALFKKETCGESPKEIKTATVRFGAGVQDGEKRITWWLDEESEETAKRRCPVWILNQ